MPICLIDLWDPCPVHHTVHHQYVTTTDTADLWFPSPTNPAVPSGDISKEITTMATDFDFEDQMLANAYAAARQLVLDTRVLDATYA